MSGIIILGAGGHGQVVADILLSAAWAGATDAPTGFLDDDEHLIGTTILGLRVHGPISRLPDVEHAGVIVAIGDNATRRRLSLTLQERGERLVNAVHPAATIASDVRLSQGVMVCPGVVVNTGSVIGNGVILNTGCTVDHYNRIGDYAHIAPGVNLGGNVNIGQGAFIGIGSAIIPGCSIGEWASVLAGSVVIKDIPPHAVAGGVPARVIRRTLDGGSPC